MKIDNIFVVVLSIFLPVINGFTENHPRINSKSKFETPVHEIVYEMRELVLDDCVRCIQGCAPPTSSGTWAWTRPSPAT